MSTITWNSGIAGDWSTALDWSSGVVPTAADDVVINAAGAYQTTISTSAAALSLTLNNATATLLDSGSLTLGGPLTVTAGTFTLDTAGALQWAAGSGVVNVASGATFHATGTHTLDNVQFNLGTPGANFAYLSFDTLTLGANAVVSYAGSTNATYASSQYITGGSLTNNGTIEAIQGGASGVIFVTTLVNNGTLLNGSASGYTVEATDFTNTGTITATNTGGIGISAFNSFTNTGVINDQGGVGFSSPNFVNNGQINISGANSYFAVDSGIGAATAPAITGTGAINVTGTNDVLIFADAELFAQGTINLTGAGAIIGVSTGLTVGAFTLGAGATINQTAGTASISPSTPVTPGNSFTNDGTINASAKGGLLTISTESFVNNGSLAVSNGDHVTLQSATTGTGTISVATGGVAEIAGTLASTDAIKFLDGASDLLKLDAATSFAASINGFSQGDTIDLSGIVATAANWSNGVLTVTESNNTTLNLAVAGSYGGATFNVASDGAGGTNITLTPGVGVINWKTPVSGDWSTGADWSGGAVPTAANDVAIGGSGAETVTITTAEAAKSLAISDALATVVDTSGLAVGGAITVGAGATFTLGGNQSNVLSANSIVNNGTMAASAALETAGGYGVGLVTPYTVNVAGTFTNNGTIVGGDVAANANFAGQSVMAAQSITAGAFVNNGVVDSGGANGGNIWIYSAGSITNNGTLAVTTAGASGLNQFVVDAPSFVNNGTVTLADANGMFFIYAYTGASAPTVTGGTGSINLAGTNTRMDLAGTETFGSGTINLSGSGAMIGFDWTGDVQTFGAQSVINHTANTAFFVDLGSAQVIENGTINASAAGGLLRIDLPRFTNNGTVAVTNGDTLKINLNTPADVTDGTGTISLATGAAVEIGGSVAATQTLAFKDAAADLLKLDTAAAVSATITGFAQGDTIDLAGIVATAANWSNGVLTVTESNNTTLALALAGAYSGSKFNLTADGLGGTNITVGPASGTLAGGLALTSATEGKATSGAVATFTDSNAADLASGFTATINWGDGTTSTGVVTGANGAFSVAPAAGHVYATEGAYTVTTSITRTADNAQLTATGSITAAEGDVLAVKSAPSLTAQAGQSLSNVVVATFSDSYTGNVASDFAATINWGDGTTSAGTVTDVNGVLSVAGSHSYTGAGTDVVTVTLNDVDGSATSTATGSATVSAASGGSTYTLTTKADNVAGGAANDTIIAATNTLSKGDVIDGGAGVNTLQLSGGGTFDLRAPTTLANVQVLQAQEGVGTAAETIYLRAGLNLTVDVASGGAGSGVTIIGANDASTIYLGAGTDVVTLGSAAETVYGGAGNDTFKVTASTIGATIIGGTGADTLVVSGGGTEVMGANITHVETVNLASSGSSYHFTANAIGGLVVNDLSVGNNDTLQAGAAGQTFTGGTGDETFIGFGSGRTTYGDTAHNFNGSTIKNFNAADAIDVSGLTFGAQTTVKYSESGSTSGDLNILQNGVLQTQIHLSGQISGSTFTAVSDGHGGTLILDQAQVLSANADGSYDIAYSAVTGQSFTSYEDIYGANGSRVATAQDNVNGIGNLVLYGSNLTVASSSAQAGVTTGSDTFALTPHAVKAISAAGSSNDLFVHGAGFGQETITGFAATGAGHDVLQFNISSFSYLNASMTQAQDLAAVLSHVNATGDAIIADSAGNSVTLVGVSLATLSAIANAADFKFV